MRVLTLDDMESRQRVFKNWYSHVYHLAQVRTAKEAQRALSGPRYDLVHLDHDLAEEHYLTLSEGLSEGRLPGMEEYAPGTGMDVVAYIVSMPKERQPQLVIVHSWNTDRAHEMVKRLQEAGVNAVYHKFTPYDPPRILCR